MLILCHWMLYLQDVPLLRVINKFHQSDCDKVDRVMELMEQYRHRLHSAGEQLVDSVNPSLADYARRLSSGLYSLQLSCLLIAFLYTSGDERIVKHIRTAFYQRDRDVSEICDVLSEQHQRIEDGDDEQQEAQVTMKRTIERMIQLITTEK